MSQVSQVLRFLHINKIVHLDLKPENILFMKNFAIKMIDFGEAYHPLVPYGGTVFFIGRLNSGLQLPLWISWDIPSASIFSWKIWRFLFWGHSLRTDLWKRPDNHQSISSLKKLQGKELHKKDIFQPRGTGELWRGYRPPNAQPFDYQSSFFLSWC